MSRIVQSIAFSLLLISIAGCVESLHALYFDADTIFDSALIGTWTSGSGPETLAFTKSDSDNAYNLLETDKDGKPGHFTVHLLKLKDSLFLDVFPDDPKLPDSDFYNGHLLPTHTFARVSQITPTLRIADMDYDWTQKFLEANPKAVGNDKVDNVYILTAPTTELQNFILNHLDDNGPFSKIVEFTKQPAK